MAEQITGNQTLADGFASLFDVVKKLQVETGELRAENRALHLEIETMKSDVRALEMNKFILFPKLAPELRLRIWGYALSNPQIIGVRVGRKDGYSYLVPVSAHSRLLRVNREARREAIHHQIPYYIPAPNIPNVHINLRIDTLWLVADSQDLAGLVRESRELMSLGLCSNRKSEVQQLAVHYKLWECTSAEWDTWQLHKYSSLKELVLVVGNGKLAEQPDVTFIRPRASPAQLGLQSWRVGAQECSVSTWEDFAAAALVKLMFNHRRFTGIIVQELLNLGRSQTQLDSDPLYSDLRAAGQWELSAVRFVEVTTESELKKFRG